MTSQRSRAQMWTWSQVCARRVEKHGLSTPLPGLAQAAAAMCGVHAQVMSAAELSLGIRVSAVTRVDVRDALWSERSLVKTYGPRGTVHLLPAAELPMWCGALSTAPWHKPSLPPALRLTDQQLQILDGAIADSLADAELTVDELDEQVVARAGPWAGELVMPAFDGWWPRWRVMISQAAHRGVLCFGPNRGRKVTYTSPARWLPGFEPAHGGLAELALKYLDAYGPATPQHFAQWLGVTRPGAVKLFESLELDEVEIEGLRAFLPPGASQSSNVEDNVEGVRLLPYFDAYSVGCHPREWVFPGQAAERGLSGGQAGTVAVVLIDGVVGGVWHQRRSGRKIAVTVELFGKVTAKRRREVESQIERVGQVMEGMPVLTLGPVTARAHL